MVTLMFNIWGDIVYGINHISQGLSDGMKGGDIQYNVTNRDFGSGFVEMLMDSVLVHLMLFMNRDNLPLGLAHNSYAMYLEFGISLFRSTQKFGHGGDPQLAKVSHMSS